MKLKEEFIVRMENEESMLIPIGGAGFAGMVRGNKTLGAILDLLKEETSAEEIIAAMKQRFDVQEEVIARDVKKALAELRKIGAIDG